MNAYILGIKFLQNRVTEVLSMLWKLEYKRNAVNNMSCNTCLPLFVLSVCISCISPHLQM